ncbi:type II secretion system protein GspM [uncultured Roseovarius sp.]|uniref:type II secretion system protein GspM n=1 Tax=uncultured Roseovarius sp. TaxID=293344 RepID=UPI00260EB3E8|nr:type II secretion system protein GspM [uncultured Roseovarius sp.]
MTALSRLTLREKWLVASSCSLLVIFALWLYVWKPLNEQRAIQQNRIARYLALINIAGETTATGREPATICTDSSALGPRITKSAEAFGVPLARLDPEGARLRITVSTVDYSEAMLWISELDASACARAIAVEMVRLTEQGQISLRMTLEEAG